MSSSVAFWGVVLVVGAFNYASRLSFIALFARRDIPPIALRALRFVPAAMLMAIIVPGVVFASRGVPGLAWSNPRLYAVTVAAVVAWRHRSMTSTIAAGMVTLWIAQWALRSLG